MKKIEKLKELAYDWGISCDQCKNFYADVGSHDELVVPGASEEDWCNWYETETNDHNFCDSFSRRKD